jgi:hypothetical protein
MKTRKFAVVLAALFSAAALSGTALADRGGHGSWGGHYHGGYHSGGHAGAFIGGALVAGALLYPWYYPYYYPYQTYPTVVEVTPPQPPVYIQQPQAAAPAADAGSWWYYCADTKTYYPYVRECASPWQRVAPQPPAAR